MIRPADADETAQAKRVAIEEVQCPVCLLLTGQKVPVLDPQLVSDGVARGGYMLGDAGEPLDAVLVATGPEVSAALAPQRLLRQDSLSVRVVSMPSWELFDAQDEDYRRAVVPPGLATISVEAGGSQGWSRWTDAFVTLERFVASAPGTELTAQLGLMPQAVFALAHQATHREAAR